MTEAQITEIVRQEVYRAVAETNAGAQGINARAADPRIAFGSDAGGYYGIKSIWKAAVSGSSVTFTQCVLPRGVTVKVLDGDAGSTLTYDMSAAGEATEWYLGVLWNTQTGHASINGAATFAGIVDQEVPADSEFVKGPICKMKKSGTSWREVAGGDYRLLLIGVLYT
jgi:hypothetical protein